MTTTERLLRETLQDPRRHVVAGVGLLDRARVEGARLRRRRRRRSVALSVAATLGVVVTGAVLSPRFAAHPLFVRPATGSLHVDRALPPGPVHPGGAVPILRHPVLWTERVAGHSVTVVAVYDGRRLCVQPDNAADAAIRPPRCAGRAPARTGLLAGPVGGVTGLSQSDAALRRIVVVTRPGVTGVTAHVTGGDVYLGYLNLIDGPGGGRLFQVVMPPGQRVTRIDALAAGGGVVGTWTPGAR